MLPGPNFVPLEVIKHLWQQEVEEGPELGEVVLQRRSRQQQLVVGGQHFQLLDQATVQVFDSVAFVHDQVLPLETLQRETGEMLLITQNMGTFFKVLV